MDSNFAGALYALLGIVFGIALTEAVRGRLRAGKQTAQRPIYSPLRLSTRTGQHTHSFRYFAAQDYYDR